MTTLTVPIRTTAPASASSATPFERALMGTAATLNRFVAARLARRTSDDGRYALGVQVEVTELRRSAIARGAIGILPR